MTVMADEIREIPERVERLLADPAPAEAVARAILARPVRWATIVGRGTSDNAATYARYLVETQLGIPAGLAAPSVTTLYRAPIDWRDGLVVAVSQSGRSPDVVGVVAAARAGGAITVAVTNEAESPLGAAAEHVLECGAGEERAVAATKTYVTELVTIARLVALLRPASPIGGGLAALPEVLTASIEAADAWLERVDVVNWVAADDRAFVLSRGYNLATALEVALKFKEACGLFAEGYSTADLQHGPVALAAPDVPVLVFRPDGPTGEAIDGGLDRIVAAGGSPAVVGGADAASRSGRTSRARALALPLDGLPEELSPAALVLPGLLLVEAVARRRGLDPDSPTGLTKVTLTT